MAVKVYISSAGLLPAFRRNLPLPSSTLKIQVAGSFETLVTTCAVLYPHADGHFGRAWELLRTCCKLTRCLCAVWRECSGLLWSVSAPPVLFSALLAVRATRFWCLSDSGENFPTAMMIIIIIISSSICCHHYAGYLHLYTWNNVTRACIVAGYLHLHTWKCF